MRRQGGVLGQTFGDLTVVAKAEGARASWVVHCKCGEQKVALQSNLVGGKTTSCGCARWPKRTLFERFYDHVSVGDDCWLWTGSVDSFGYGSFTLGRENGRSVSVRSNRQSWQFEHGPISEGMHVLHRCDVPACVRPSHLFLGSHQENMADKQQKQRQARGERAGLAKLTNEEVLFIRAAVESRESLARKFDVTSQCVFLITERRNWRHL